MVAASAFISVTRVTDHMHHPTDVVAGAILGTLVQTLNCIFVQQLARDGVPSVLGGAAEDAAESGDGPSERSPL